MTAPIAKTQFEFVLPNLSYIDAKWEEPSLRQQAAPQRASRGFGDWLAARVASFRNWRENQTAQFELAGMSDYELHDVGLTRVDLARAFDPAHNQDLMERGLHR